jgi:signal transduction histidine kinase
VCLRVADDGPGVSRELRGRIFEPGFSTKTSGWGIGLSLARRIVEEGHGGSLQLAAADRGAAFEIILP